MKESEFSCTVHKEVRHSSDHMGCGWIIVHCLLAGSRNSEKNSCPTISFLLVAVQPGLASVKLCLEFIVVLGSIDSFTLLIIICSCNL